MAGKVIMQERKAAIAIEKRNQQVLALNNRILCSQNQDFMDILSSVTAKLIILLSFLSVSPLFSLHDKINFSIPDTDYISILLT